MRWTICSHSLILLDAAQLLGGAFLFFFMTADRGEKKHGQRKQDEDDPVLGKDLRVFFINVVR